jgi:hypothetical protein
MAAVQMGMQGDTARVRARLEAAIEGITRASGNGCGLRITADASVDKTSNPLDLLAIIAEKLVFLSAWL